MGQSAKLKLHTEHERPSSEVANRVSVSGFLGNQISLSDAQFAFWFSQM